MLLALFLVHNNCFDPPWNIFCYFKAQYKFFFSNDNGEGVKDSEMDGFLIKKESAFSQWGLVSSPLKASWGIKSPLDWETVGQVEEGETKMEPFDQWTKTTGTCLLGTIRHKQNISPVMQGGSLMLRR